MIDARLTTLTATALAIAAVAAPVAHAGSKAHVAQAADCGAIDARPGDVSTTEIRAATLCLLNIERNERSVASLHSNTSLGKVAARYSRQMVDDRFFDHVSPGGSSLVTRVRKTTYLRGARSWSLGENLAWGTGSLATPRQTVEDWMNSPGHRANILNGKFRDIGIGVAEGTPSAGSDGATYTTNFGRRT
jgi:uncharacterized protein YkwD